MPQTATSVCKCATTSDCAGVSGKSACVPYVVNDAVYAKAYICRPNDGANGNGCNGSVTCGTDCMTDSAGNSFCTKGCSASSQCGAAGVGCCKPAKCNNAVFSCDFPNACVPC